MVAYIYSLVKTLEVDEQDSERTGAKRRHQCSLQIVLVKMQFIPNNRNFTKNKSGEKRKYVSACLEHSMKVYTPMNMILPRTMRRIRSPWKPWARKKLSSWNAFSDSWNYLLATLRAGKTPPLIHVVSQVTFKLNRLIGPGR